MNQTTPQRYEQLEAEGANHLGRLMFAFGRLEFAVGLLVHNLNKGTYPTDSSFQSLLKALERAVDERNPELGDCPELYRDWIVRADEMRKLRNEFVHGRWVPNPITMTIANVKVTSKKFEQREDHYSLAELAELVQRVVDLNVRLNRLISGEAMRDRSNRSVDTDTPRQGAARRSFDHAPRGALPPRAGHL